ncbi:hypothetical protein H2O64_06415 [Kordia sp. YSTF-M3]|uniref:Uncharacterized protein n=1 Tax=Kordia aestuariivivens TaxID=2759037 RepID=A0ABR7Q6Z6_9FLAO|nr:hypothetical protein [Kordia aestuariivivens]MBC8754297.1 hypothetical protein [Kordia aestuariivivens]
MKKLIIRVAFAAAILFSGAMLFQVENVDAQDATHTDAEPVDAFPDLGKWIKMYNGDGVYWRDECWKHTADECRVGQWRKPQAVPAGPAVPGGN